MRRIRFGAVHNTVIKYTRNYNIGSMTLMTNHLIYIYGLTASYMREHTYSGAEFMITTNTKITLQ